jgi:hypothetical protein
MSLEENKAIAQWRIGIGIGFITSAPLIDALVAQNTRSEHRTHRRR